MRTLWICLLLVLPVAAKEKELVKNGGIKSPQAWTNTGGNATTTFKLDRKTGKHKKGSLYFTNTNADDKTAHNWRTSFRVPKGKPYRLKLTAQIRTKGMAPGAKANVMIQCWPEKGNAVGYAWCQEVTDDTDWQQIHTVFHVPEACKTVNVLAYLVGKGEVWFDDFSVTKTKEDLTAPPTGGGGDGKYWKLARKCAAEIPWLFDAAEAKARAKKERKPILLYVRSVDNKEGLVSAATTLAAAKVPNRDDGLRKDVLFRAGPLSDPDVAALITERFVPLLATYHFGSHHAGSGGRVGWIAVERGGAATMDTKGHLVVTNNGETRFTPGWIQMLRMRGGRARKVRIQGRIKTKGMAAGSEAGLELNVWGGLKPVTLATKPLAGSRNWRTVDETFDVPAQFKQVRFHAFVKGRGEAWFDDLSVTDAGQEQLFNGTIDPTLGVDPLQAFGLSGKDTITPALVVVHKDKTHKLHRIGTLSTDLVDRFLLGALADKTLARTAKTGRGVAKARALIRLGEYAMALEALDGQNGADAALARAIVHCRRGDWEAALAELTAASGSREVLWRRAWCEQRMGRDAKASWTALAKTDDRWGRRAAACLLPQGPRLWLSHSERAWPQFRALPEQSEGVEGFDAAQSVQLLLELQNTDGSFGSHSGAIGFGYWDGTITAYSAEALWRWLDHLPPALKRRAAAAHDRAVGWLRKWTQRKYDRLDAFNAGYALSYLVRVGEREAGERLMPRIAKGQLPDGNWTVYHAGRPASFNTAISVMALAQAKAAGWDVPEEVLEKGAKALAAMRQAGDLFPYSTGPGHEWMTTEHGSIARDTLCEHTLVLAGIGDKSKIPPALERYMKHAHELRVPTKAYYDYFNQRGHGGYYFFFAHRNALEAAALAPPAVRKRVAAYVRGQVLQAREGDGAFMDHSMNGRGYGTAQALILLAPR